VAVPIELDSHAEYTLPAGEVLLGYLEIGFGRLLRPRHPALLCLEEVQRDSVRVEGLQELLAFVGELGELP
jgi:hypothetical protein